MTGLDINTKEIQKVIDLLKQKKFSIQSKFDELDETLLLINGENAIWQGKTQQALYENYLKTSKNFPSQIEELEGLISFLTSTIERYESDENKRIQTIEDNASNLDIN